MSDGFNPPRIGNIVNNFQFQFDGPIQDNAYFDKGFQICDGKIAVGTDTTFYQCLSGGFYNIYYGFGQDQQQCNPVVLSTFDCVPASNVPSGAQTSFPIKTGPIPGKTGLKLPSGSSSPVTSAASSAASSSSKASSSAPITSSAVISSVVSSAVSSAKYPVGNTTVIAPTGTGVTPVTSTPGSGSKTTSTSARASFTGAANMLAAGQKLVGAVAGVAAFAMF